MTKTSDYYLQEIKHQLSLKAPDNRSNIPIAMSQEDGTWFVFITIDRPQRSNVTVDTSDEELSSALQKAWQVLQRFDSLEANSIRGDRAFGLTYGANTLSAG